MGALPAPGGVGSCSSRALSLRGLERASWGHPHWCWLGRSDNGVVGGGLAAASPMERRPQPHIVGHCGQRAKDVTSLLLGHLDSKCQVGIWGQSLFQRTVSLLERNCPGAGEA